MIRPLVMASALLSTAAFVASAQPTPPAVADSSVSANAVAEHYAALLERDYVYPAIGKRYAQALRAGIASGRYAALTGDALAAALGATVQAVSPDGHLRVRAPDSGARAPGSPRPQKPPIEQAGWIAPGVAFVRFNVFPDDAAVTAAAARFMADHADARTIIFDIRTHNGGGLSQMDAIFPWLFSQPTRLVSMATRASVDAEGGSPVDGIASTRKVVGDPEMVTREHWATPNDDKRLRDAQVYILTSGASRSAAEHFALAMKHARRGLLVGAPTGGANHFGRGEDLGGGFSAFIPVGRSYDPETGKDWEGDGVQPDIAVAPADALLRVLTDLGITPDEAKRLSDAHMPAWPMERRQGPDATAAR